jgi:hypothetical protein
MKGISYKFRFHTASWYVEFPWLVLGQTTPRLLSSTSKSGFVSEAGENEAGKADCRLARRCSLIEAESQGIEVQTQYSIRK